MVGGGTTTYVPPIGSMAATTFGVRTDLRIMLNLKGYIVNAPCRGRANHSLRLTSCRETTAAERRSTNTTNVANKQDIVFL